MANQRLWLAVTAATVLMLSLAACGSDDDDGGDGGDGEETFTIAVSNTLVGNQWREQMVCAIKAQARVSGVVDRVVLSNRDTDASGQISDIEGLIGQGVDAIIVNPADRTALDDVIAAADEQGILVISVDQAVTAEAAYNVTNDQVAYAEIGARWLFEQLGGSGNVLYMRGFDGHPADADRDQGFQQALADFPDITIAQEVFTGWDPSTGAQQALDILSTQQIDGIWTSGIDYSVVEQFQAAGHDYVPIVGADNNGFIQQLIELREDGLEGAIVSNPPPVGGVATAIAVDLLTEAQEHEQNTLLTPELHDNVDDLAALEELYLPELAEGESSTIEIEPYTTYTVQDVLDCKGPGE
jgi:ribose transport system substrate-binding protein